MLLAALAVPGTAAATFPGANGPLFFQDGDEIVTASQGGGFLGDADIFAHAQFSVSPDGTKLAYSRDTGSEDAEIVVHTLGGPINSGVNVTNNTADDTSVAFCGNNRLVFTSDRAGSDDLWIMGADGSNPVQLTNTPGAVGDDYEPSCSRTGEVFFQRIAPGFDPLGAGTHDWQIWKVPSCGGTPTQVTLGSADSPTNFRRATTPDVSPDGTKVAFGGTNVSANETGLWLIHPSGGAPSKLLSLSNAPYDVVWSPDGTKIAYSTFQGDIFTVKSSIPADTPQERPIGDGHNADGPIAWGAEVPNTTPAIPDPVCSDPTDPTDPTDPGGNGGGGGGGGTQPPSNAFSAAKPKPNASKGTVTVQVTLPGPGSLDAVATAKVPKALVSARKVKITVARKKVNAKKAGTLKLTLKPKKKAKGALKAKGKLKATLKLTFVPTGGSPKSSKKSVTFKLKRPRS